MAAVAQLPPAATSSWARDLQAYERQRRHEIDPGLLAGPTVCLDNGSIARAERAFDPLVQKWRDPEKESALKSLEERERLGHLNRARDLQLKREHNHNIVTHDDRSAPCQGGDGILMSVAADDPNTNPMPTSCLDYNILSNRPFEEHHWGAPETRPRMKHRDPKPRRVKGVHVRDFNVLTNRYLSDHEAKTERDNALTLLEATSKFRAQNVFDPISQQLTDPRSEEQVTAFQDMYVAMTQTHEETVEPPSNRGRPTNFYDMITHRVKDEGMLQMLNAAEEARKHRYKAKFEKERLQRTQDIQFEDLEIIQRCERVAPERHFEQVSHGYDIVTNSYFGNGPRMQKQYLPPYFVPKLNMWDQIRDGLGSEAASEQGRLPLSASKPMSERGSARNQAATTPSAAPASARPLGGSGRSRGAAAAPALAEAGAQALDTSARTYRSGAAGVAPPAPVIPGTPSGSVYSARSRNTQRPPG
jgi:hypothetical protein